jgi:hypothetical protein
VQAFCFDVRVVEEGRSVQLDADRFRRGDGLFTVKPDAPHGYRLEAIDPGMPDRGSL